MKPQPWAEALDHVVAQGDSTGATASRRARARRCAVHPGHGSPAGAGAVAGLRLRPLRGHRRARLRARPRDLGLEVSVVSLGDYVLNGGEVAVLAMVEAIGRLVPGVIGNAESLVEESHEDGLLEYPIYTKPREWNGREVPPILLSGNHAAIAAWRHEQRLARTAARRPDLLHASHGDGEVEISAATPGDVPELNLLYKACWVQEALLNDTLDIPALVREPSRTCGPASTRRRPGWRARPGRLVGAVRTSRHGDDWFIGRLCVVPDLRGRGLGRRLLELCRVDRAGRHTHVVARHRRAERRQPADVQEGRLPRRARMRPTCPGAVRPHQAPAALRLPTLRRRATRGGRGPACSRRRMSSASTPAVIACVAMMAKSTSTWAVAACTALPPPSMTPMKAPGQRDDAGRAHLVQAGDDALGHPARDDLVDGLVRCQAERQAGLVLVVLLAQGREGATADERVHRHGVAEDDADDGMSAMPYEGDRRGSAAGSRARAPRRRPSPAAAQGHAGAPDAPVVVVTAMANMRPTPGARATSTRRPRVMMRAAMLSWGWRAPRPRPTGGRGRVGRAGWRRPSRAGARRGRRPRASRG